MKKYLFILCLIFSVDSFAVDVYIGGIMTTDGFDKTPAYWHNGVLKKFFNENSYYNRYNYVCMAVEDEKVYVCLADKYNTYVCCDGKALYQLERKSNAKETRMLVLNGNVFLCIDNDLFRNGKAVSVEGYCGGDLVVYNGLICYDFGDWGYFNNYKYPYFYYKGYCLAGNTYKCNHSEYWLGGERAYSSSSAVPEVRYHAMKTYNSDIYVLCSYNGDEMRLLKNNEVISSFPYRRSFRDYSIIDYAYVSGRFAFLHSGSEPYIENPFGEGNKLLQASVLNRMESIAVGNGAWGLFVLGKESSGPIMKPCYWTILVTAQGNAMVQNPQYLPQCVEAYDLIVQ